MKTHHPFGSTHTCVAADPRVGRGGRRKPAAVATPALVDPARWEDGEGFRETFLLVIPEPRFHQALRVLGAGLYDLALEHARHWPAQPEGETRAQLRAAVADLRHLQGFLATVARGPQDFDLTPADTHLSRLAGKKGEVLRTVADDLEAELGPWRGA